ncbi:MAG: tetratricopeptide repeat protein [Nitrospirota bacterium]|nr:MAG: tetratricopeptide repeat protein [Nitrospirota bacterium]
MLWGGLLLLITIVAYVPAIDGGFVWDDDSYVTENQNLRSLQGLYRIWFEIGAVPQYYPMVHSTFWVEYHLWELDPLGYHLVNVILHGLNAILVWLVLTRLSVPGAWLAAAVFALHPVHVESVAWITERKNVLSGFFYLSSLLAYLRFLSLGNTESGGHDSATLESNTYVVPWRFYVLALLLYFCALLSKTVTCTLPAVILLLLWWKRDRLQWRDFVPLIPFFVLGVALGLTTVWMEQNVVGAQGEEWTSLSILDRFLIAGRVLWFYVGKLLWPSTLTFSYPRWHIDAHVWWEYFFPLSVALVLAVLWYLRKQIGKAPLAAVLFFMGTLAPALGFIDVFPMQFSFVADHFQYLASIGLIALFVALLWSGLEQYLPRRLGYTVGVVLLVVLATLVWRQGYIYKNLETLWRDTITKNPSSWMAHTNLGKELYHQNRFQEAIQHFYSALRLKPDYYLAHHNLGKVLTDQGRLDEAVHHYTESLRLANNYPNAHIGLGNVLLKQNRSGEAIDHFSTALLLDPNSEPAHLNWGAALYQQGKFAEAIQHYAEVLRMKPHSAEAHNSMGAALASQEKYVEAAGHFNAALRINPGIEGARANLELLLRLMQEKGIELKTGATP